MKKVNRQSPPAAAHGKAARSKCPMTGKVRFRDKREAVGALHQAVAYRHRKDADGEACRRQKRRSYVRSFCHGWHLTSQPMHDVMLEDAA